MPDNNYLEDDFITEALRQMVKNISIKDLRLALGLEKEPTVDVWISSNLAQIIDKTSVQITAYMRGRESRDV